MSSTPTVRLSDGQTIPQLGLGTWPMDDAQTRAAVLVVPREDIRVTTKLRGAQHGYQQALAGFEESRRRLGVDYADLFLIHWPLPSRNQYVDTWRALCHLQQDGVVRSIGVSNFALSALDSGHRLGGDPDSYIEL